MVDVQNPYEGPSTPALQALLKQGYIEGTCLWDAQQPIGFALLSVLPPEVELLDLRIAPRRRGRGLGRLLLEHLLADLARRGAVSWWLEVRESNCPALRLYQGLGFYQVGIREHYYPTADGTEHAILMALDIPKADHE